MIIYQTSSDHRVGLPHSTAEISANRAKVFYLNTKISDYIYKDIDI
jgi:hypothetical protein